MIIDSHQHVMLPVELQLEKMDAAGVERAVLFTTTPHVERAQPPTLEAIAREMNLLYRLLDGSCPPQERIARMYTAIEELKHSIAAAPDRFTGFGPVPLGLSREDTAAWVDGQIRGNGFVGLGEFTPGTPEQMLLLEAVFAAAADYLRLPLWVHTFNPVTAEGIRILMDLCRRYPRVPVIFGHMCGSSWMEAVAFASERENVYLDLSAAFTPLSVRTALLEAPEKCLFSSDAPFGEPELCRRLVEFVSPSPAVTEMALGGNARRMLEG